ncbi:MAG: 4Fe-4S dicluster domain-containing protein [Candidatus Bathyarchaeota archaeon]|nr:MAG: 4Fe-4S dicluster domain-containing protein [Candidatus Bathyarchaeota archaeon]
MPMKLERNETDKELSVRRILHTKNYSLTVDKTLCTGCEICQAICPKEAIEIKMLPKVPGEKRKHATIDVDGEKCHFCGICSSLCPFGALKVRVNSEHVFPVVKTESFPELIREINVNSTKCDIKCVDCEKACPLELIKVSVQTPDGKTVKNVDSIRDKKKLRVVVDVKKEFCPCCRLCELKCPEDAIRIKKFFQGIIHIRQEKCPEDCQDCLDVCPIPGALFLADDGKVHVNEIHCVYCGACRVVCPEEGALELQRTRIWHTPVRSGAWNKALEKLTSTKDLTKELQKKGTTRIRDSVKKRFDLGDD